MSLKRREIADSLKRIIDEIVRLRDEYDITNDYVKKTQILDEFMKRTIQAYRLLAELTTFIE